MRDIMVWLVSQDLGPVENGRSKYRIFYFDSFSDVLSSFYLLFNNSSTGVQNVTPCREKQGQINEGPLYYLFNGCVTKY